ncbi:MAG: DUF4112 domain-containing protein [Hyphomicrobium sp.]|jgi:hypothetical protein
MDARVERYMDPEIEAAVARVEALARIMDGIVEIPGTKVRIGVDAMLGLVPVLGDLLSQAISSYIIWEARRLGVSRFTMARMIGNSAIDTVIGIVPFVGDAFDIVFRANMKNLALLKAHLAKHGHVSRKTGGKAGPIIDIPSRRVG